MHQYVTQLGYLVDDPMQTTHCYHHAAAADTKNNLRTTKNFAHLYFVHCSSYLMITQKTSLNHNIQEGEVAGAVYVYKHGTFSRMHHE